MPNPSPLFLPCLISSISCSTSLFSPVSVPLFSIVLTVVKMSSSVCQGLPSCLELRVIEPGASKIKLAHSIRLSTKYCLPQSDIKEPKQHTLSEENNSSSKDVDNGDFDGHRKSELGCWEFIQALTNSSYPYKEAYNNEKAYVHPFIKRSASMVLDQKKLEMCTESLGSETGSYTSKSDDEVPLLSLKSGKKFPVREGPKEPEIVDTKKTNCNRRFPPPLSSISSLDCVQLSRHRAGGSLVIKAVRVSTFHTYFQAERGDGRLRLRFLKGRSQNFDHESDEDEVEEEDEEVSEEVEDFEGGEEEEEENYHEDDSDCVYGCEDIEGRSGNVELETGKEKSQRPTRCMEGGGYGGTSLLNCETLWIVT